MPEASQLPCLQGLARPQHPEIDGHTPHHAHDLQREYYQRDGLHRMALVAWRMIDRGDPSLPGVVATGRRDEQALGPLHPQPIVIDQDLDRVSPELPVDIDANVAEPNLALSAHGTGDLAEAEDAPQAADAHWSPLGMAEPHLGRQRVDPALGRLACVGPRAPDLLVRHARRVLRVDQRPRRTAKDGGIQPPALDRTAAFREVLPGMSLGQGASRDAERCQARLQGEAHGPMIADAGSGSTPPRDGLATDVAQP